MSPDDVSKQGSASTGPRRDASGRFQASGEAPAKPVKVWLKPDVLKRLDAYCTLYGIGRGRAIGHLLQGALPDPQWLPAGVSLLHSLSDMEPSFRDDSPGEPAAASVSSDDADPELSALMTAPPSQPLFRAGDRVANRQGSRCGSIAAEPCQWVAPRRLANGDLRLGHWSYAVVWDGQAGLIINYAEDLLKPRLDPIELNGG